MVTLPALSVAVQVTACVPSVDVSTGPQPVFAVSIRESASVAFAAAVATEPCTSTFVGLMVGASAGGVLSYRQDTLLNPSSPAWLRQPACEPLELVLVLTVIGDGVANGGLPKPQFWIPE